MFEIYNKANALVDTIESNSRGLAVSKPLPLGRYIVKEVSSPQYYSRQRGRSDGVSGA